MGIITLLDCQLRLTMPATMPSRTKNKRDCLILAILIICLLQAQPAFTFGGFPLAKLASSVCSISGCPKTCAAISPSCAVDRISPVLERIAATPHCGGVSISSRSVWALRGKYDSLEEAIAYARAQAGRGPVSEGGDQAGDKRNDKDESSSCGIPEARVEKVKGEPDSNTAKSAVAKPSPSNKASQPSETAEKKNAPEGISAKATEKMKEPIKAEAVKQAMKEKLERGGLDVEKEAPGGDASDAPAAGKATVATGKTQRTSSGQGLFGAKPKEQTSNLAVSKPETVVVVTGATGRVGQLAVRRILELYDRVLVRAVVTDYSKGIRVLREEQDMYGVKLEIMAADLQSMRSAGKVVAGASAVVFCASGFAQSVSLFQRLANAVRLALNPKSVAEIEGVKFTALALKAAKKVLPAKMAAGTQNGLQEDESSELQPLFPNAPRFVLLSSAAVTRPEWSGEEKALYPLAAEIPIVKLNPLNILNIKAEGEKELREVGIPYTVVRPCGLNDDHPRGRPLFSVGDTAAGRICREDVADVLVRCLGTPEATGKTFEVQTLPGLDKVASSGKNKAGIGRALANLPIDEALEKDPELLKNIRRTTYPVLTQLRPVPLTQTTEQED